MTFHYLPDGGSALRVLARPDLVLMTSASGAHLDALWAAVDGGADGPGLLDALTVGGISRTPDFVLAAGLGGPSAVVMARGAHAAVISVSGEERRVDGAGVSSWVEQVVEGVTGCRLGAGPVGGASLPLRHGVVPASVVSWGDLAPGATSAPSGESAAAPVVQPATAPVAAPVMEPAVAVPVAAVPVSAPVPAPDQAPDATLGGAAITIAPPSETELVESATVAPDQSGEAASGYDHLFGATVMRSVEGAAVRPEETGDAEDAATDRTVVVADIAALRAQRRAERARGTAAPAAPRFVVELADGRVEPLDQSIIVGRSPSATRVSGSAVPRLVTLTTPNNDLSRSHAQIGVEGDTVVVTDLHSMNGTLVTLPGRNPQRLREGEPTTVVVGTVIDLGDGATLTVKEA